MKSIWSKIKHWKTSTKKKKNTHQNVFDHHKFINNKCNRYAHKHDLWFKNYN